MPNYANRSYCTAKGSYKDVPEMHAWEEYLLFIYCYYVIAFSVLLQAKLTTLLQTEINRR